MNAIRALIRVTWELASSQLSASDLLLQLWSSWWDRRELVCFGKFLKCFGKFITETICDWCSKFWKFINYWFNFFNEPQTDFLFPLAWVLQIVSFKDLVHFIWVIKFVSIELIIVFIILLMSVGFTMMSSFLFLIFVICVFSLFFLVWLEAYRFYWAFLKVSFWFSWFSLLISHFKFHWFLF